MSARGLLLVGATIAALVGTSVAAATTNMSRSQPNGDLGILVSAGTLTNRDRDGDFSTLTNGDVASVHYGVDNRVATQTVHITFQVDGPGTDFDRAFERDVVIAQGDIYQQNLALYKVKKNATPRGTYSVTVTASGTETGSTAATFTVN
jgi:opacity protein-like surface antigen